MIKEKRDKSRNDSRNKNINESINESRNENINESKNQSINKDTNQISIGECLKQLIIFIKPHRFKLAIGLIMVLIANITFALLPIVEGGITTQLAKDAKEIIDKVQGAHVHFEILIRIILTLITIYIIKTVSQLITAVYLTDAIQKTMHDIRDALQKKIQRLPVRYFDDHAFGDILSCVTNDVDTLSNALQQTLSRVLAAILTFIFVISMMLYINVKMALVTLLIIPLTFIITRFFVKRSQKLFNVQQETLGELNGTITELYGGFNEILLYNKQDSSIAKFEDVNNRMCEASFKGQFVSALIHPFVSFVAYAIIGVASIMGCIFVLQGVMPLGNLQAFIRYIWQLNDPLSQVSQLSAQIQSAYSAMSRIFTLLNEEEEQSKGSIDIDPEKIKGDVTFEHVEFGYDDDLLMKDVNFTVKRGQMVALVGPTGAGKTTMMNLLLRFYDVRGGSIKIDGINIMDMDREQLRELFSLVLQDTWLFSGSIYDNIRYGRLDARKDEVIDAAKTANVHHYIRTLTKGYHSLINEEASNISSGEKQLLTIARAILKDPQILILDEATSSVDTRLERRLQDAMKRVMAGRTSFVIAHRLSTIRNADLILVIQDGDIVEQGTHESLLEKKGFYEKLYYSQFAKENGEEI